MTKLIGHANPAGPRPARGAGFGAARPAAWLVGATICALLPGLAGVRAQPVTVPAPVAAAPAPAASTPGPAAPIVLPSDGATAPKALSRRERRLQRLARLREQQRDNPQPAASATPTPTPLPSPSHSTAPAPTGTPAPSASVAPSAAPTGLPTGAAAATATKDDGAGNAKGGWLGPGLSALALALGGAWFLRRRQTMAAAGGSATPAPADAPDRARADAAARQAVIDAYEAMPVANADTGPVAPSPSPPPPARPPALPPAPPRPVAEVAPLILSPTVPPPLPGQFVPADVPGARASSVSALAPLGLDIVPERLTISLVMATLRYRLRIANRGETALGEVIVRGDMVAAHGSKPESEQLALNGVVLPECHHFIGLAPGESAEHSGEIRVNLAELEPIRVGNAALFVPLLRFQASAVAVSGAVVEETLALAVGEPPSTPGAGIRPFRLDQGPRLYGEIAARKLEPVG